MVRPGSTRSISRSGKSRTLSMSMRPVRPREIAYYNPPYVPTVSPGSNHATQRATQQPGGPDYCAAQVHLDAEQGTLWTTCQDNGLLSLKFTHNAWPFAESRTPPGMQN